MSKGYTAKNLVRKFCKVLWHQMHINITGSPRHDAEMDLFFTGTEDIRLNDADKSSYEKIFSSILVPYTALTVGEEIGQGE